MAAYARRVCVRVAADDSHSVPAAPLVLQRALLLGTASGAVAADLRPVPHTSCRQ